MNKITGRAMLVLALGAIAALSAAASAQQKRPAAKKHEPHVKSEINSMPNQPIACSLFGLTEQQRRRQQELRELLFKSSPEVRELADGYAIGLPATSENILAIAEFVTLERLCCPFFRFELAVGGNAEPVWLRLTGGKDVKEFLKAELLSK